MKINEVLQWARVELCAAGVSVTYENKYDATTAAIEAEALLEFCLGKSRAKLIADAKNNLSSSQLEDYKKLIARRSSGEPIAYIIGVKEFWSLPIGVSPAVLIPRCDSELLVEHCIKEASIRAINILELGCGSGAVALALASELPKCNITATDLSADAIKIARDNLIHLNKNNHKIRRVNFMRGNWFAAVTRSSKFAIIVSNPPYVAATDAHLSNGDVRFEPRAALVADEYGLADLKFIIANARDYLTDDGVLMVEHGATQGEAVRELFSHYAYKKITTQRDVGNRERLTLGRY